MPVKDCPYEIDGQSYLGKLVFDVASGAHRPIVVMAPNWMGVSEEAVERARLLAGDRYAVFVADPYGRDRRPLSPAEAGPLAEALKDDPRQHRLRMATALRVATEEAAAIAAGDPKRRAAIGFCLGGKSVLELARTGADIAAVVSIHGDLTSALPAAPGDVVASILALHGSEDPIAPKAQRDAFEAEMQGAGARWQLMVFGGAIHAFTDPDADVPGIARYEPAAARTTYELTHAFLREAFSGPSA
ncbi:dienelactone hydrolase family protein [Bosea sp. NPDC003192]|uniref:dienelactone hydrolase family protein n=1 Tax=Bosea sp. NPDC003192 TaxID=3390551 RepID=UPI003D055589